MIHKYDPYFRYSGDDVKIKSPTKLYELDGVMPNYGSTKSKKERNETYERRKKAWDNGVTPTGHGSHYRTGKELGWIWDFCPRFFRNVTFVALQVMLLNYGM